MNSNMWATIGILFLLCASNAHALGLAYEYMDNNTITVAQGTQRVFRLTIQNEENKEYQVNISVQSDIAKIRGNTLMTVPAKTYDTTSDILITVPDNAKIDTTYTIQFLVIPFENGQQNSKMTYNREFNVLVGPPAPQQMLLPERTNTEQPKELPTRQNAFDSLGVTLTLIIIIAAITMLIWRSSRKQSKTITKSKVENKTIENPETKNITPVQINKTTNQIRTPETIIQSPPIHEQQPPQKEPENNIFVAEHSTKAEPTPDPLDKIVPPEFFHPQTDEITEEKAIETVLAKQMPRESLASKFTQEIENTFNNDTFNNNKLNDNSIAKLPKATGNERFFMHNGIALEDLAQLRDTLFHITDEQFYEYVNSTKHDFASWTEGVFAMHDLAEHMRQATTRNALYEVLTHEI